MSFLEILQFLGMSDFDKGRDEGRGQGYSPGMRPVDLQIIGEELAIKWEDQTESYLRLERLRRACPCAGCRGEIDVLGQLHKGPDIPLAHQSFQLTRISPVGGYAVQPFWADGHSSGLFTFDYLRRVAEAQREHGSGEGG